MKRAILAGAMLLLASKALCAELLVPINYPTIQAAIDMAMPGDTVIIAPGIYTGVGNRNISFSGKPVTVQSIDPNDPWIVDNTTIDCSWSGRGFYIDADAVLDGLTITHGNSSEGGGIMTDWQYAPMIRKCNIRNNSAVYGGGICSDNGLTLIDCNINNNTASQQGGGIFVYAYGTVVIDNCRISNNLALFIGGGIYCFTDPEGQPMKITRSMITDNVALQSLGGGISVYGTGVVLTDECKILNNQAFEGGGILCSQANVKVSRSLIAGNFATGEGGGVSANSGSVDISESVISENYSQNSGGGLLIINQAVVTAKGCTFTGNASNSAGGGVGVDKGSFKNCIFWGNSDAGGIGPSAQINTWSNNTEVLFSCIQDYDPNDGDIPFGGADNGNIDDDPLFVWLPGDYGDFHLGPNSPCIDAGTPFYAPGPNETDIDGQPRVIGNAVDMGADEYGKMIVVKRPVNDEIWATGSKHQIKWEGFGVNSVNILLSADNGQNWETLAAGITDSNSYLWVLPDDIDSNQCLISVVPASGDANVICHKSGLFTVKWYPVQPAVPPELQHKGLLPAPDLGENKGPQLGCVKWVFDTNGPVSSQVAITRPYWNSYGVYITSEKGLIYALDDMGELIWSCDINTPIVGSPAVGYYWMVYVAGQNGWLYAIDDYAQIRWTHVTNGPISATPVVGYSGKIYLCSQDGLIYAIDADGSELWTFETKGPGNFKGAILTTPVIEKNGVVYVAGLYDPNLYALDANSGSIKWVCKFASASDPNNTKCAELFAPPAIAPNGTIYQTLVNDQNLYAIDPCTGNIIWSTSLAQNSDTNSSGWSSPVVGPNGTIYVSFDDPYLRAVEPNGTIKWVTRLGMVGGFTLSIDRDGLIYAASDDAYVCVVDSNGAELSRFKGVGWVSFPAIAEDGAVIVSDSNNRVWAITNTPCEPQQMVLHRPQDLQPSWAVDFMDFAVLANSWLACTDPADESCSASISTYGIYAPGDINRDLYVDYWDVVEVANKWLMETN